MTCDDVQVAVSARADGEPTDPATVAAIDQHLGTCATCRDFERDLHDLRSSLRLEPVDRVPDIATAVMARLRPAEPGRARPARRLPARQRPTRRRTAVAAAVAAVAGVVAGATFVGLGDPARRPAAADIPERVLAAQHDITSLDSRLTITEAVPRDDGERTFDARLTYRAPETLSLAAAETTPGIADRDRASGELVVDGDRWWQSTARRCFPAAGRVRCPDDQVAWSRSVTGRQPFSEAAPVPLDLVSPVDSFTLAATPPEAGERTIAGRRAVGVVVTAAQVDPLLDGLSAAVTLAPVHPTDPVELWLDADHLVPLGLAVRAADSADRAAWAAATGAADAPGEVVLRVDTVEATINGPPGPAPEVPGRAPAAGDGRAVTSVDAGFRAVPGDDPVLAAVPVSDALPAGLHAHRSGAVTTPDGPDVGIRSWSDGRAWLTVQATTSWPGGRLFGGLDTGVVPVDLGRAGTAYASGDEGKVALHTGTLDVVVAGSLPLDELREVAGGLGLVGEPVPAGWAESSAATVDEAAARLPGLLTARGADGFAPDLAMRIDGDTVTELRSGPGERAFTLTQRPADVLPPPSSGDEAGVTVRGTAGRYSAERGELEWVEDRRAVSLRSSSLGLAELVGIARGLEPAS